MNILKFKLIQHGKYAWNSRTNSTVRSSELRFGLVLLHSRFISGGSSNRQRQNCLCIQLDRHTTIKETQAADFHPAKHVVNEFNP